MAGQDWPAVSFISVRKWELGQERDSKIYPCERRRRNQREGKRKKKKKKEMKERRKTGKKEKKWNKQIKKERNEREGREMEVTYEDARSGQPPR